MSFRKGKLAQLRRASTLDIMTFKRPTYLRYLITNLLPQTCDVEQRIQPPRLKGHIGLCQLPYSKMNRSIDPSQRENGLKGNLWLCFS